MSERGAYRMRMLRRTNEALEDEIKIGDLVEVERDGGTIERRQVEHEPWQLGSGQWVIGLDGIRGGFHLGRCRLVERSIKGAI